MIRRLVVLGLAGLLVSGLTACGHVSALEPDSGTDADADADSDADTDADSDSDSDTDSDTETDSGTGTEAEAIVLDCSDCPGVGGDLQHMACAIDLCDPDVLLGQTLTTPCEFIGCALEDTYEAVARFGDDGNDLAPRLGDSYALLATGAATGTIHTSNCDPDCQANDPWALNQDTKAFDVVEWRLVLKAPDEAVAFRFRYVFFSEEYDDYVDAPSDDKFYAVLEAGGTNGGNPTVITFGPCREEEHTNFASEGCGTPDGKCC
ncbi:MAG TPA: hypothetical protein VM285_17115, partial [Polyangia bacterium]|nr:hypothetical protein [Polyangia bacterium]